MNELNARLFEQPYEEFERHLTIPDNERIIFSANFGMGKTTFLKWFFSETEAAKKYNAIHLFPVNYSVASNEDIFKYIKYDVIIELLKNGYTVTEHEIGLNDILKLYFKRNSVKLVASIINMIPILGKQVIDAYDRIRPLIDSFDEIRKELENEKPENILLNYIDEIENSDGNIFEDSIITKIIEGILTSKSDDEFKKENVLIIDDLDRIDPEHIFRLLNIFAAHFDRPNYLMSKNKFGFDKVIFVCDIKNIREIFRAKFGLSVDFNGYIDKFFSTTVFNFDHTKYYSEFIYTYVNKAVYYNVTYGVKDASSIPINENNPFLKYFLKACITNKLFDLRNIIKMASQPFQYKGSYEIDSIYRLAYHEYRPIIALKFLHDIKGHVDAVYDSIESLKNRPLGIDERGIKHVCGELILFLMFEYDTKSNNIKYNLLDENLTFIYQDASIRERYLTNVTTSENIEYKLRDKHLVELLLRCVRFMDNHRIF